MVRVGRELWDRRRLADLDLALASGSQWPNGGPLNGQQGRQRLVRWIGQQIEFTGAIETGTWRASSTCFLADVLGCPIWTVEANPRTYRYAAHILAGRDDVHAWRDDSRHFLARFDEHDRTDPTFLYLDAHWDPDDLPLWEEIQLVFARWAQPVVMIDDFRVPGDPGYGYDDYGPGKSLELRDLTTHLPDRAILLAPTLASASETGACRGCVILTTERLAARLRGDRLREISPR